MYLTPKNSPKLLLILCAYSSDIMHVLHRENCLFFTVGSGAENLLSSSKKVFFFFFLRDGFRYVDSAQQETVIYSKESFLAHKECWLIGLLCCCWSCCFFRGKGCQLKW